MRDLHVRNPEPGKGLVSYRICQGSQWDETRNPSERPVLGLLQGLLPVLSPVLPAAFSILPTAIRENIEQYNLDPAAPFYGSLLPAG